MEKIENEEILKKPMKYYTAFVMYAQESLTQKTVQIHCTHKYLGAQDDNAMSAVARMIDKFFSAQKRVFPLAKFTDRVEWPKASSKTVIETSAGIHAPPAEIAMVSVLTTKTPTEEFFPDLKLELDQFRPDDYLVYQPHVTIPTYPDVTGQFQCYAIMTDERVVMYWNNPKWQQEQNEVARREMLKRKRLGRVGRAPKPKRKLHLMD